MPKFNLASTEQSKIIILREKGDPERVANRNKNIVSLVRDGSLISEIAQKYDLSREYIRQIVRESKIVPVFLTTWKIAQLISKENLHMPFKKIYSRMQDLVPKMKGVRKKRFNRPYRNGIKKRIYRVHSGDIDKVKEIIMNEDFWETKCIECGTKVDSTKQKRCASCSQKRNRSNQRAKLIRSKTSSISMRSSTPWIIKSIELLKKHTVDRENETWLSLNNAFQTAGMKSACSLVWMRARGVLSKYTDPDKKWRGKIIEFYAQSEMEIIYDVREKLGLIKKP